MQRICRMCTDHFLIRYNSGPCQWIDCESCGTIQIGTGHRILYSIVNIVGERGPGDEVVEISSGIWTWCCLDTSMKALIQLYISIANKWKFREVCLHCVLGGLNKGDSTR